MRSNSYLLNNFDRLFIISSDYILKNEIYLIYANDPQNDEELTSLIFESGFISKNLYTLGLSNAIDLPYIRILLKF
ncbi:hypothetical protein BpHYR1_018581 [Brachionus plicatilis]|uniref:Uncharacterized protein n=1 Tax=Brachionus plicatilis TaxID=10195 RepID=A0A3M7QI44_BRAPC|nr:hypothetical protein BpHYR1_018581 [Brachionus plicatilis]